MEPNADAIHELNDAESAILRFMFLGPGLFVALAILAVCHVPWSGRLLAAWIVVWPTLNWFLPFGDGPAERETRALRRQRLRDGAAAAARVFGDFWVWARKRLIAWLAAHVLFRPARPERAAAHYAIAPRPQAFFAPALPRIPPALIFTLAALMISAVVAGGVYLIGRDHGGDKVTAEWDEAKLQTRTRVAEARVSIGAAARESAARTNQATNERTAYVERIVPAIERTPDSPALDAPAEAGAGGPPPQPDPGLLYAGAFEHFGLRDGPRFRALPAGDAA